MKSRTGAAWLAGLASLAGIVGAPRGAERLTTVLATESGVEVLEVRGPEVQAYELSLTPDGRILLRFPGRALDPPDPPGSGGLAVSVEGDRVTLGPDARLVAISSAAGVLRLSAARGAGTVPADVYRIGVGDKLRIHIYGDENFTDREVRVVEDGTISIPYLGEVAAAGLTLSEAADEMTRRLSAGYLVNPKLSLDVVEYQSQWVNVAGEVERPGRYYLRGRMRLVDVLAQAGGLKREAGTEIRLTRPRPDGSDEVTRVRRDALYMTDDPAANPVLRSGDTVTVATEEYFFIKGEVKSPGRYPIASETTILKAISLAGGFDQYANRKKVELLRKKGEETLRLVINVERIESRKGEDVPILPGDIINVRARFL